MHERVGFRIDERQLNIVVLMHHHQRAGNRAIESHGMNFSPRIIDDDLLFLDHHRKLDNLRPTLCDLAVSVDEWRVHQLHFLPGKCCNFRCTGLPDRAVTPGGCCCEHRRKRTRECCSCKYCAAVDLHLVCHRFSPIR
ncbi:hypothetical protein D9M68_946760 [compost metagenome]